MKNEILLKLRKMKKDLSDLKKKVESNPYDRVNRKELKQAADDIATFWVEEIRSSLEFTFNIDNEIIKETSEQMKHLHILSRPNNLKTSYLNTINTILHSFDDKFILPIKQSSGTLNRVLDLDKIIPALTDVDESNYFAEAINCAKAGYWRASIVMGWCAIINRIQLKLLDVGLERFNQTSKTLKNKSKGKYKKWNKEFSISTKSELQQVFDRDLLIILEGMNLIDSNQLERMLTCFQYRNHSAHPGNAPINENHVVTFFSDITTIILQNPKFSF
jgi:hypothetical protein